MMGEKPPKFDECFSAAAGSSELAAYMAILEARAARRPDASHPEKHHIVPREWLSRRFQDFSFWTEDPRNVVYLSVDDKLAAMQHLVLVFLDMRDSVTYGSLVGSMSRRYHIPKGEFWRNPYLDPAARRILSERRRRELSQRKTKYSDEFLERCRDVLLSSESSAEGFGRVAEETGFPFTKRALVEQLRKRGLLK